ncbi:hypothetical protein BDP27DRAFT_1371785 [Rhodocollybia butyracea]|uniref:Uncharacterized protein n=1 Tax=Rhodocollybia butyracea TaxID=206335 RepID=A0A9P5TYC6_9AGAR|nr:hypothetical protein BDP27DRAFT_1371785 [Rhodocollybia butyracea]
MTLKRKLSEDQTAHSETPQLATHVPIEPDTKHPRTNAPTPGERRYTIIGPALHSSVATAAYYFPFTFHSPPAAKPVSNAQLAQVPARNEIIAEGAFAIPVDGEFVPATAASDAPCVDESDSPGSIPVTSDTCTALTGISPSPAHPVTPSPSPSAEIAPVTNKDMMQASSKLSLDQQDISCSPNHSSPTVNRKRRLSEGEGLQDNPVDNASHGSKSNGKQRGRLRTSVRPSPAKKPKMTLLSLRKGKIYVYSPKW